MKILYVTTIALTMGFFPEHFKMLTDAGHTVELACNNEDGLPQSCSGFDFKVHHIPFSRSPLSKNNVTAIKRLKSIIKEGGYDIIHTHTPNASICVRLAAKNFRKKGLRVFYTAHGFHFYKGAPLKNWLMFFPAEWLCSFFTDKLITINTEDYNLAKAKMHAKETVYVPGVGLDLSRFGNSAVTREEKRKELGIPKDATVLLSVGELNQNKNHETVLKAIGDLDIYYIIAGVGDKEAELGKLSEDLNISDRIKLLGYRKDVSELYRAADIFVFPSLREGLSVSLMEAMSTGLPCAVSKIRGNTDLIDNLGGCFFEPQNAAECKKAISTLISSQREVLGRYNIEKVKAFSNEMVIKKMKDIYSVTE